MRQNPAISTQLFPLSQKVVLPSFIFVVMSLIKKILCFHTFTLFTFFSILVHEEKLKHTFLKTGSL